MIPRRIIQTGKRRELPLLEQASVANLTLLNPDFEYIYFTDEDVVAFISTEFPEHFETFNTFPYKIQRFDFFRYLAVYRLGGFYFDLDVFLARGLADLTGFDCVFPFEELTLNRFLRQQCSLDWEIGNYGFGAEAGHPFLARVIQNCVRGQRDPAWVSPMFTGIPKPFRDGFEVLNTTGPGLISRTLAEKDGAADGVTVLFPDDVCDQSTWHRFGDYGVHLMSASWRGRRGYFRGKLALWWESSTRKSFMHRSRALGPTRRLPESRVAR